MNDTSTRTNKKPKAAAQPSSEPPLEIVVRRGAIKRFDQLARKTNDLNVQVTWDRRVAARRRQTTEVATERRDSDRRQPDPFTWVTADFVVVGDRSGERAAPPARRRRG